MFQRYVLLTNYAWYVEEFRAALPDCAGPDSGSRQMPAWHHALPGRTGLTMVNIGVGPSNAKTITDHLAVLRPDLVLMIGHCAGLRNRQEIGDLVLATAYMRDDRVLDDILPLSVPVVSNHTLNTLLLSELTGRGLRSRMGIVFTTANRNWELRLALVEDRLRVSRALAVDMESATVAANGFRYRIPTATLLAVSDKPLHARPKLSADAQGFYTASRRQHVDIAIAVAEKVRQLYPGGLPTADLRSPDEPLLGITGPEATAAPLSSSGRGTEGTQSPPLSTYNAPGGLRQDPGRAAEWLAGARIYGNGVVKCVCCCRRTGRAGTSDRWPDSRCGCGHSARGSGPDRS